MGGKGESHESNSVSAPSDIEFFTRQKTKRRKMTRGLTRSRKGLTRSRRLKQEIKQAKTKKRG